MAWTDQCKIAFKTNATALLYKQRGRHNVTAVLKTLHEGSGIPFETLKRWYYEKEKCVNNDTDEITHQNNSENTPKETAETAKKMCIRCGVKPIYKMNDTGKPLSERSPYYGMCGNCRVIMSKKKSDNVKSDHSQIGIETVCPKCGEVFFIDPKTLKLGG